MVWKDLTDQQLLGATFEALDPAALQDLLEELPGNDEIPSVEFAYDTKHRTGLKIRCVHCRYPNHFCGFVLKFSNGARILVGKDCGKKIYGVDFTHMQKEFESAKDRAYYLRRRHTILSSAAGFLHALDQLVAHASLKQFREIRRSYMREMPQLARMTFEACTNGEGGMFVDEKVRDLEAEAKREEQAEIAQQRLDKISKTEKRKLNKLKARPIYRVIPKRIGTIKGLPFFRTGESPPNERFGILRRELSALIASLEIESLSTPRLISLQADLSKRISEVLAVFDSLASLPDAFEVGNLLLIAQWATARATDGSSYSAESGALRWHRRDQSKPVVVVGPSNYRIPDRRPFEDFMHITYS